MSERGSINSTVWPGLPAALRHVVRLGVCLCLVGLGAPAAFAEGFPGQGNPADWSDALPYYNLANRYLEKGRYEDAIAKYQEAISRYRFDPDFFVNLGVAYRKSDDYESAAVAFEKAIALNDKDWVAWSNLANAYLKQNKLKETVSTFQRVLKLNPPAAEKAAIQKDIADINKILSMQGGPPAASAPAPGKKPAAARGGTGAPPAPPPPLPSPPSVDKKGLQGSGWDYVYK